MGKNRLIVRCEIYFSIPAWKTGKIVELRNKIFGPFDN